MADPVHLPELIISLSHDNVGFQLLEDLQLNRKPWSANFPIEAMFVEEQLSRVFDEALKQNPSLIDHFDRVEVVVTDRPNVTMPAHYEDNGHWSAIAHQYLRNRSGDQLVLETIADEALLVYNLPENAIRLIKEYYANAGRVHLNSILWLAIHNHIRTLPDPGLRLFHILRENTLIILGASEGKLTFTKTWAVSNITDLSYYIVACSNMMQPAENWAVTLQDEMLQLNLDQVTGIKFHNTLALGEMQALIASHRSCAL